jgi:hypothetical protein
VRQVASLQLCTVCARWIRGLAILLGHIAGFARARVKAEVRHLDLAT